MHKTDSKLKDLRVTCVVDNTVRRSSQLWGEHGVSFWISTAAGAVLLDTGQSGNVLCHNLEVLGLDPHVLKAVALSHAHYDHVGGLRALAESAAPQLPLYANAALLKERFARRGDDYRVLGLAGEEAWLEKHFTLHLSDAPQELLPGVWTTGAITQRPHPEGRSAQHCIRSADDYAPDDYRDDLSLVLETKAGLWVLCGCCHAGLLNTLEHVRREFSAPIIGIAGGTHLVSADADSLAAIAQTLAGWGTLCRLYLNHCSGEDAYYTLRRDLGAQVVRSCPAGTTLDIGGDN